VEKDNAIPRLDGQHLGMKNAADLSSVIHRVAYRGSKKGCCKIGEVCIGKNERN
jgi:hypothetical protein